MQKNFDKNKSLALTHFSSNFRDINVKLQDLVDITGKHELYEPFVKQFLKYIPIDYRSPKKTKLFSQITSDAFEFFLQKSNNDKVAVSVTTSNKETTMLVVTENKPFIIDSINTLITKLALQPILAFYPVISASRTNGKLIGINLADSKNESLVYIKIAGEFDNKLIDNIKSEINRVIELVELTYNSWKNLLQKLVNITDNITDNINLYKNTNVTESLDFLKWIQDDNITFLAILEFDLSLRKLKQSHGVNEIWRDNLDEISTIIQIANSQSYKDKIVILGKINKLSPIHRNTLIDYILIKTLDEDGVCRSATMILGLYGTAMYFQSIKNTPILRNKLDYVIKESGFMKNGYNAKKIKNIVESLPRDILIQINERDLYIMCIDMLSSMRSGKLKLFIQHDWSNSFINIMVFMRRDRLTPDTYSKISNYFVQQFAAHIINDNITVVAQDFTHILTTLKADSSKIQNYSYDKIKKNLINITADWSDNLLNNLCNKFGKHGGRTRHKNIITCFCEKYRYSFSPDLALDDLHYLELSSKRNQLVANLSRNGSFILKFYSPDKSLILSDTLPIIENLGFVVTKEEGFLIKESNYFKRTWIHEFKLSTQEQLDIDFESLKHNVEESLEKINNNQIKNDTLNKLLILAGFDWRSINLLRAISSYCHQIGSLYGNEYTKQVITTHSKFAQMAVELFDARFNPQNANKILEESIIKRISQYLDNVSVASEDKILHALLAVITAILRTNFYQKRSYISFKVKSNQVPDLPLPVPYAEIFVYSHNFEGIHLRGGKVARGGIRWSDRLEDYRMEVLGLMKSQMTKNTVIVPTGSKGVFCVKLESSNIKKDKYLNETIKCYKNFLRGLLDITDNIVDGKIIQRENTVIYDDNNPYLVVAADKGTATFSDYANEVSQEYKLWLGDAFASGGSDGYDHKKMGITARGGWVSAKTHLLDIGVDADKHSFTVIGIGDMSGDVFGNFMLLSKNIKLIAAFNHQHIFVDPNPDEKISYKERSRLFNIRGSRWSDYNSKLLSSGGGVFDRSSKIINISPEIKKILNIEASSLTPNSLIKFILKAEVDLLWSGGIGTYIKSSSENNADINDKTNDNLRVNGNELRAKIISEGANLCLSQLGRIEYALSGGRVNTDFIDNSAGVDCSDHEVNIKIVLNIAITSNKISLEERNSLLSQMSKTVEKLVLQDNTDQVLALTLAQNSSAINIESFNRIVKELEKSKLLDRDVEFLPNKTELSKRSANGETITRPELAVLLSYTKMKLDHELSSYAMNDKYFQRYLFEYFPEQMHQKFSGEITKHPLSEEIIKTVLINKFVNQLGSALISDIRQETEASPIDIIKAYVVTSNVCNIDYLWNSILKINSPSIDTKIEILSDISRMIRRGVIWFIKNKLPIKIDEVIEKFSRSVEGIINTSNSAIKSQIKTNTSEKIERYTAFTKSKNLANAITTLEILVSIFDIIHIAQECNAKYEEVAEIYFRIGKEFRIDWVRDICNNKPNQSHWKRIAIQSLKDNLYSKQRRLVRRIVKNNKKNSKEWIRRNLHTFSTFINFVNEIKAQKHVDPEIMVIANKKLETALNKVKQYES